VAELLNHQKRKVSDNTTETPHVFMENMIIDPDMVFNPASSQRDYIDPRIIVAWCLKNNIDFEKVFTRSERIKFRWAIDMADRNFAFSKETSVSN
jgi:hypothetical protein